MAGKMKSPILVFIYLLCLLLLTGAVLLSVVVSFVEASFVNELLERHWDTIQEMTGSELTLSEAEELVGNYLHVIGGVGIGWALLLFLAVSSSMRMLGVRKIVLSFLCCLFVLGVAQGYFAVASLGKVPKITSWLLFSCAGIQVISACAGSCGFKYVNRECICWLFFTLSLSCAALCYVAVSTFLWIKQKDSEENPEQLLLLFAISVVSCFFSVVTLAFALIHYCRQRRSFRARERSKEIHGEFSQSSRPSGRGRRPVAAHRKRTSEVSARHAL